MTRQHRGTMSHYAGVAAEDRVAQLYQFRGFQILQRRWRGQAGEIDLILQHRARVVFVEVKAARDLCMAAQRITRRQLLRIAAAAEEFLGCCPDGQLTEMQIDVALVSRTGKCEILENAYFA
ncbi:MAG: YraN family protein [Rhodobacteraceae bacterium]|nr:YraN family protein [Paracoccaceae bacterium]